MEATVVQYRCLNDAASQGARIGLALGPGTTQVWYMQPDWFRMGIMGELPSNPGDLSETHVLLGSIAATNLDLIYSVMQGECWSPNGEANNLIERKGLEHTSMSVGDVIVVNGERHMVDRCGFAQF